MAHYYRPRCKCPKEMKEKNKCKCGATWGFMIDIGNDPKTGERRQRGRSGFKNIKEARIACAKFITELNKGTYVEETDINFEEFSNQWLSMYESTGTRKPGTVRVRQKERLRLLDYFAKLKLKSITRKQYQDALNDLKERGYAKQTMNGIHVTGRMIFKKAIELELLIKDPTEFAYVPREQKTVEDLENKREIPKYLEKEELALFLATAEQHGLDRDHPVFVTLAYTGMRIGELCALKWKDIDFETGSINITKTYYNPKNNIKKYSLGPPKTKASERVIEIDEDVLDVLKAHKKHQNKIKMQYRDSYYDKDFVFAEEGKNYAGYPTYPKKFENRMETLLKMTDVNHELTPHSLRHTHTSLLAEIGISLDQIMDRLGHVDDRQTKLVYNHVTKPRKKEPAHKFSELMRGLR
ncbi:MAG: site-specific integrase [Bacillota bacterium]|nr:site-specific integrase [Bacillota bacterium]